MSLIRRPSSPAKLLLCLVLAAAAGTVPGMAWTAAARVEIVRDAVRLMPESLRELMIHHERELLAGLLEPGSAEDQPEHWQHPEGAYGTAARRAEEDAEGLAAAVNGRVPFSEVMHRFGRLAHWVSDVNDPLHAGDRDPRLRAYYRDYQTYLEQQLPRFPLVFQGYRDATLSAGGPEAYLMRSAQRAREYGRAVGRAYDPEGRRISLEAFDERSLAFGVGSLSYSNAVNDISRVWLWTWEQAHGDTSRTPLPLPSADGAAGGDEDTIP
jgi:hypothetical protein